MTLTRHRGHGIREIRVKKLQTLMDGAVVAMDAQRQIEQMIFREMRDLTVWGVKPHIVL